MNKPVFQHLSDNQDAGLPALTRHLLNFSFLNAINFSIAVGAPVILLAKHFGAGESILGVMMSMTALFSILQIFSITAAHKIGHGRVMVLGWRARSFILMLAAPLPLLQDEWPASWLLAALMAVMFGFNFVRGFSAGVWLPWITHLVPGKIRGRYFGYEQMTAHAAALVTLLASGWFLGASPEGWRYSVLLLIASIAGLFSVAALGNVPQKVDMDDSEAAAERHKLTWQNIRTVWTVVPFRIITLFVAFWTFVMSGMYGFVIIFLKDCLNLSEGTILVLGTGSTFGAMLMAYFIGGLADRFGSRPFMRMSGLGHIAMIALWVLISCGIIPGHFALIMLIYFVTGVIGASNYIPLTRLILVSCPSEILTIGMTVHQTVISLCAGLSPIIWGVMLQLLREGGVEHPFRIFFSTMLLLCACSQIMLSFVNEPKAMGTKDFVGKLIKSTQVRFFSVFRSND